MLSRILIRLATVWAVFVVIVAIGVLWNTKHGGELWWSVAIWAFGPLVLAWVLAWVFAPKK